MKKTILITFCALICSIASFGYTAFVKADYTTNLSFSDGYWNYNNVVDVYFAELKNVTANFYYEGSNASVRMSCGGIRYYIWGADSPTPYTSIELGVYGITKLFASGRCTPAELPYAYSKLTINW